MQDRERATAAKKKKKSIFVSFAHFKGKNGEETI